MLNRYACLIGSELMFWFHAKDEVDALDRARACNPLVDSVRLDPLVKEKS